MAVALTGARLSASSEEEELKERETIAIFITKVWKLVETPEYNKYIHWSDVSSSIIEWHLLILYSYTQNGKTFVVCDYPNFAREVLPHYFKHSNFSSFVRQLNLCTFNTAYTSRCQGYSRVIKVIQFLPIYIIIITR